MTQYNVVRNHLDGEPRYLKLVAVKISSSHHANASCNKTHVTGEVGRYRWLFMTTLKLFMCVNLLYFRNRHAGCANAAFCTIIGFLSGGFCKILF